MEDNTIPTFPTTWSSARWLKAKFYPDLEPYFQNMVISILETGILFKEDALQLEDALQIDNVFNGGNKKHRLVAFRFSSGECVLSAVAIGVCIAIIPIKYSISFKGNLCRALFWAGAGATLPLVNRFIVPNTLSVLLKTLAEYTVLVRKCMACVREQSMHSRSPRSMSVNTMNAVLIEQHRELCLIFERANTALQPLFPWLTTSPLFELSVETNSIAANENLIKLHHLFLILQSHFLKTVGLGHLGKQNLSARFKKNRNEKIYWIHNSIFPVISDFVQYHLSSLHNAYKIFKDNNFNKDSTSKSLPKIAREPWQYSEVHANIVLCSTEIRSALIKSNEMDTFLEACWNAKSKFSPAILEEDLLKLKEDVVKCFATIDTISIQLKKIHTAEMRLLEQAVQKLHLPAVEEEEIDVSSMKTVSEVTVIDTHDEVYYFEKTDDYIPNESAKDCHTGPGVDEIKTTKVVLDELKIKLVKREDDMRQREAIALENTMPEYKGNLPDFPRQIICNNKKEDIEQPISSLPSENVQRGNIENNKEISDNTNEKLKLCDTLEEKKDFDLKTDSNDIASVSTKLQNNDLFDCSDSESNESENLNLLEDIRRNRVVKKKNHPPTDFRMKESKFSGDSSALINNEQNGNNDSEPMEYRFGTGMAMASLLHIGKANTETFTPNNSEEVFAGSGEVSEDSGNET